LSLVVDLVRSVNPSVRPRSIRLLGHTYISDGTKTECKHFMMAMTVSLRKHYYLLLIYK